MYTVSIIIVDKKIPCCEYQLIYFFVFHLYLSFYHRKNNHQYSWTCQLEILQKSHIVYIGTHTYNWYEVVKIREPLETVAI